MKMKNADLGFMHPGVGQDAFRIKLQRKTPRIRKHRYGQLN